MRFLPAILVCVAGALGGCSWWERMTVRSQSPDEQPAEASSVRLVGDLAVPYALFPVEVDAVGLVGGLHGTGSDPGPSQYRQALLSDMQARGVDSPNSVLASPDTAMVLVRGVIRPGIQKGDHFDIEVRIPSRSETTSLSGGYLLECDLRELAVLGNQIHSGRVLARAAGPVMIDPSAAGKSDSVRATRGRILGGGVALKSRPLGLVLVPEHQSVLNSARIENAVNKRFYSAHQGVKAGTATAKTDKYVELQVYPKYKDNVERYVQVCRAIGLRETEAERQQRLAVLEKQLLDPISSSRAALQLEAIGQHGIAVLRKGVASGATEVRFRAAEALAYLDQSEAAEPLAQIARDEPAFRVFALAALSAMDDLAAADQLHELLNGSSAETRYGAFRALWAMNRSDPLVAGESLGGQFSYHVLDASGTPMIHLTRSRLPEVVLFGRDQRLAGPVALEAGNRIMVVGNEPGKVSVSKFAVDELDQKRVVSDRVDEVIRAIVELGGTYPDVVQALEQAKQKGALASRLEVDALPEAGRTHDRVAQSQPEMEGQPTASSDDSSSTPGFLAKLRGYEPDPKGNSGVESGESSSKPPDSDRTRHPVKAFFAKMVGREDQREEQVEAAAAHKPGTKS
jgi:flagellar basal body P-ring protein FlgI